MKSVRLLGLPVAGVLMLAIGSPAGAGEFVDRVRQGSPADAIERGMDDERDRRLVDLLMADDQNRLVDTLSDLEAALEEAEGTLDEAELGAQEASIEAAGALLAKIDAEARVETARRVVARAEQALDGAEDDLATVMTLPVSQENNSEIAFIEKDIVSLRQNLQLATEDLYRAEDRYRATHTRLATAEAAIGTAERAVQRQRREIDTTERRIAEAHGAFDSEREKVLALVADLSGEQRGALQGSLGSLVNDRFVAVDIGAAQLKRIVEDTYNTAQIRFLAKALRVDAEFRQFAALTGNESLRSEVEREKAKYMAEIDRLEAEKFDDTLGNRSAFGIASHPGRKKSDTAE